MTIMILIQYEPTIWKVRSEESQSNENGNELCKMHVQYKVKVMIQHPSVLVTNIVIFVICQLQEPCSKIHQAPPIIFETFLHILWNSSAKCRYNDVFETSMCTSELMWSPVVKLPHSTKTVSQLCVTNRFTHAFHLNFGEKNMPSKKTFSFSCACIMGSFMDPRYISAHESHILLRENPQNNPSTFFNRLF